MTMFRNIIYKLGLFHSGYTYSLKWIDIPITRCYDESVGKYWLLNVIWFCSFILSCFICIKIGTTVDEFSSLFLLWTRKFLKYKIEQSCDHVFIKFMIANIWQVDHNWRWETVLFAFLLTIDMRKKQLKTHLNFQRIVFFFIPIMYIVSFNI